MKDYTREELISICENAVVPCEKWEDKDSYSAQVTISTIYNILKAGSIFKVAAVENDIIWLDFSGNIKSIIKNINKFKYNLNIDDLEDYREKVDPKTETEIFKGNGVQVYDDINKYQGGYIPTEEKLNEVNGGDWY